MYFVFPRVHHNTYVVAGDIIQFGSTTVFRFNHPQEAAEMKDEVIAVCVAVQVLYRFSILLLLLFYYLSHRYEAKGDFWNSRHFHHGTYIHIVVA